MRFKVKFQAVKNFCAVEIPQHFLGLKALDSLRVFFSDPKIGEKQVHGVCVEKHVNIIINLIENEARQSGCFSETHTITVRVPRGFLNFGCFKVPVKYPSGDVGFKTDWDRDKIFEAWSKAGFPLKWEDEN